MSSVMIVDLIPMDDSDDAHLYAGKKVADAIINCPFSDLTEFERLTFYAMADCFAEVTSFGDFEECLQDFYKLCDLYGVEVL